MLQLRRHRVGALWILEPDLQDVGEVSDARKRLRGSKRQKTPVRVVVVKPGIENSGDAKSAGTRHHPKWRKPPLRAHQRYVVSRRHLPVVRQLLANQDAV